jgi:hypothetical protein
MKNKQVVTAAQNRKILEAALAAFHSNKHMNFSFKLFN